MTATGPERHGPTLALRAARHRLHRAPSPRAPGRAPQRALTSPLLRNPLAFPRDAAWLPDGSLGIADAATEVLRVADPLGDFEVVGAKAASGVYAVGVVGCGETACF